MAMGYLPEKLSLIWDDYFKPSVVGIYVINKYKELHKIILLFANKEIRVSFLTGK